jgi:hypothetical protein
LAHLASVLTNEFVLADLPLSREEFHGLFAGALGTPTSSARKAKRNKMIR